VDLDRQEVLKSWAAPSASRVDSVLSDALTHHYSVRFPGLERLAGLRGAARRALGQEAEPWEVHHDGIRQLRVVARGVFRLRGSPDREEVEDAEALVATVFGERPGRSVPDALWHIRDDPRTRALFFDDGEDDVWSEPLSPA
jgi:hypothetical protein